MIIENLHNNNSNKNDSNINDNNNSNNGNIQPAQPVILARHLDI